MDEKDRFEKAGEYTIQVCVSTNVQGPRFEPLVTSLRVLPGSPSSLSVETSIEDVLGQIGVPLAFDVKISSVDAFGNVVPFTNLPSELKLTPKESSLTLQTVCMLYVESLYLTSCFCLLHARARLDLSVGLLFILGCV